MILGNKDIHKEPSIQSAVIARKENVLTCGSSMGPVLQNLLVITEKKHFDQAPQRKGFDILSESKFHGIQKDILSIIRDENKVIPQEKCSSNCGFEKVWSGHSSASHIINTLRGTSQWCHYLAWALCLLLSLSCLVLSTVLGMR